MALEISMSSIKYVSQSDHILCSKRPIYLACKPKGTLGKVVEEERPLTPREKESTQRLLSERKFVLLIKGKIQAYRKILLRTLLRRVSVVMSSSLEKALL